MEYTETYVEINDVEKMIDEAYDFLISKHMFSSYDLCCEIKNRLNEMKITLNDIYSHSDGISW